MFGFGPSIDVDKISKEISENTALLLDVREDDEWESGHAAGAIHFSLGRLSEGEVPTKDTEKKLYVYCASGGRSGVAEQTLSAKGFTVDNIGGLSNWRSAGGKTE